MKPTRLTRADRWRAKAGATFYYVTFDCGHETMYTRLFSKAHYRDRWAAKWADRCGHIERGRVTFKKSFMLTPYQQAGWR